MRGPDRNPGLDALLDLHGETLFVDDKRRRRDSMRTLKIGIADYDHMKARTLAIARGEHTPAKGEPKVWFTSIESFAKLLSEHNRRLLGLIARERPRSLTELAEKAGRSKSNLSRTLKTMSRYGLVELTRGERGKLVPRVPYDQVRLDVSLTGTRHGSVSAGP
ncbi:helix-turn-helix domain-containing protein [Candidatus Palauibacter sp.]|uniref:HVO_A0114 family putative DNA-binding protein n=1 Tax=Candidatus Palauibacter sp. TaxID=3101350 RepID=UPI003B529BB5